MLTANKQRISQVYECVKSFHNLEVLPEDLPNPQNQFLKPKLRPYQLKAVKWMLFKELCISFGPQDTKSLTESPVILPKGGILAEEMGLGKTVEVLACILSNPRIVNGFAPTTCPKASTSSCKYEDTNKHNVSSVIQVGGDFKEVGIIESKDLDIIVEKDNMNGVKSLTDRSCIISDQEKINLIKIDTNSINTENKNLIQLKDNACSPKLKSRKRKLNIGVKNQSPSIINDIKIGDDRSLKKKRNTSSKGENYAMLKAWYDDCLSETSAQPKKVKKSRSEYTFQCCCIKDVSSNNTVECSNCMTWQHAECVGYTDTTAQHEYFCFQCWQNQQLVPSAGTVIISPEAISQQWVSEIEKHVEKDNLKILVYEGVRENGYIQPYDLADYDIVITTYQVLTKELNYTKPVQRNLRHAKRFFAPTSPLIFVEWWRLCLDEAQMVEGSSCRAAEMAKRFTAINKWAVTGTPIQKAVNDLIGLIEFLAGPDNPDFLALVDRDWRNLLKLMPRLLWRTQMKDVMNELGVPPQTVETHLLDFSKIEKYFYECTHTNCSKQFCERITRFSDLSITLKSVDRKVIGNLLNPLLRLRQACLHPQAVRGRFISVKQTMTMQDLVVQMVMDARNDAEQALRQLVAALNGSGALHIIRKEWVLAAEAYRTVLHLEQEHKDRLKIDSLQKIHTMHNLAEVLDGCFEGVPPTLRDSTLQEDTKALQLRYLGSREALIVTTEERLSVHMEAIATMLGDTPLGYTDWWLRLLEWTNDRDELLDRLKAAIQLTDAQQKNQYNNLANKLKSLYIVRAEVATWLAELDRNRQTVWKWIKDLQGYSKDKMAEDALLCHLPQAALLKKRTRCKICLAENALKTYEALLFEEKSKEKRKNRKRNLPGSSDWTQGKDLDNKEIAELVDVNVNTFESSKKGGFKASPFEKILKALAVFGRQRHAPSTLTKEASQHLTLLDKVKKEFLDLNLLWRQIFDLVDAIDELNMCKMRLRLPYTGEEQELENKKKKIGENQHIIAPYRVEPELHKLETERKQYEVYLKKKVGTLCFLENLEKEGTPNATCPVCHNDLTDKWSVLQCGHCLCLECLPHLPKSSKTKVCPQCRQPCDIEDLSYVESKPDQPPRDLKGSFSTKVDAIVSHTTQLTREEPNIKILVFSVWDKVLKLLAEAYQKNNITFRQLFGSAKQKQRQYMKEFKAGDITVLLLPLRSGAKGLNLIEATHVFLVEPILNPAEELQAVSRVHRIGQTKPTFVHRFIVRDTIEERIMAAVAASAAEQWSDDCVTLQQMFDLFSNNDNTQNTNEPTPNQPGPSTLNLTSSDNNSSSEEEDMLETVSEMIDSEDECI